MMKVIDCCLIIITITLNSRCNGGQFWHISDLHLDYFYESGGNISNWCHENNVDSVAVDAVSTVGPAGNYHCDSPYPLVLSALQAMQSFSPNPDFIVWTGDSSPHWRDPSPPDDEYILNVTKRVFTKLDQLFPNVPVVPALGNHDASPPDQFPQPTEEENSPAYYKNLWKKGAFGDHIQPVGKETFEKCGYFIKMIKSKVDGGLDLKFIVLNTNIYYSDKLTSGEDPCDQISWLNQTLIGTDETKEKVFIVSHVPPGSFELSPGHINFNSPEDHASEIHRKFIGLVSQEDIARKISAHLYGHLHTDTFRLFLDRATFQHPRGVAFMAGSVTPVLWGPDGVVGVNPTIRLVTYDDDDLTLQDYDVYSLDIELANKIWAQKKSENDSNQRKKRNSMEDSQDMIVSSQVKTTSFPAVPALNNALNLSSEEVKPKDNKENTSNVTDVHTSSSVDDKTTTNNNTVEDNSTLTVNAEIVEGNTTATDIGTDNSSSVATSNNLISVVKSNNLTSVVARNNSEGGDFFDQTNNSSNPIGTSNNTTVSTGNDNITLDISTDVTTPNNQTSNITSNVTSISENLTSTSTNVTSPSANDTPSSENVTSPDNQTPNTESIVTKDNYVQHLTDQWKSLYNAKTAFKIDNLTAYSMFESYKQMVIGKENGEIFQNYVLHNTGGHNTSDILGKCDELCWHSHLCTITNLVEDDLKLCLTDSQHFYYQTKTTSKEEVIEMEETKSEREEKLLEQNVDVKIKKIEADMTDDFTTRTVSIFMGVFGVALAVLLVMLGVKKYRENRSRSQEFLLTDSVFRYDGYYQLEED